MDKLDTLNEFYKRVNNGEKEFIISSENDYSIHFISCKHGEAEYFYGCKKYGLNNFRNLDNSYELAAIFAKGRFYIIKWLIFNIYSLNENKEGLPENVIGFDDYYKEINRILFDIYYPKYYIELKTTRKSDVDIMEDDIIRTAKIRLLTNKKEYDKRKIEGIPKDRIAEMLCNNSNIKSVCMEILNEQKPLIDYIKSKEEIIQDLIDGGKVVEEWEYELANSVNQTKAKTVIAEFELNGKSAEAKIECERIIWNLLRNDYFISYNFHTTVIGNKLLKELGASESYKAIETNLYAKNIKSITFRGKKIYERKN